MISTSFQFSTFRSFLHRLRQHVNINNSEIHGSSSDPPFRLFNYINIYSFRAWSSMRLPQILSCSLWEIQKVILYKPQPGEYIRMSEIVLFKLWRVRKYLRLSLSDCTFANINALLQSHRCYVRSAWESSWKLFDSLSTRYTSTNVQ